MQQLRELYLEELEREEIEELIGSASLPGDTIYRAGFDAFLAAEAAYEGTDPEDY